MSLSQISWKAVPRVLSRWMSSTDVVLVIITSDTVTGRRETRELLDCQGSCWVMSCWLQDLTNCTSISASINPLIMTSVVVWSDGWYWLQWDAADDAGVVERFCCSHLPSQLTSSSNEALIIFQSNMSSVSTTERRGFQLGYSTGDYDILHTYRLAACRLPWLSCY